MKKFDITFTKIGCVVIEAETKTEAYKIADTYKEEDIDWGDIEVTDVQEED